MKRLADVLGLLYILLVALAPNVAWPATPAPSPTLPPGGFAGPKTLHPCAKLIDSAGHWFACAITPAPLNAEFSCGWTNPQTGRKAACAIVPSPSPTPHHWLCNYAWETVCVPLPPSPKPTHVPSPLPYVIMCQRDKEHCKIYKLRNGAYEFLESASPWPGITP